MIKNIPVLFAAAACLAMVSCDTPSDYRPSRKVSVDFVPPGERSTFNVSDAGDGTEATHDVHGAEETGTMLNHDEHVSDIKADTTTAPEDPAHHINNPDSVGVEPF